MSICKGCRGFNTGIGDYCPKCIQEANTVTHTKPNVTQPTPNVTHKPPIKSVTSKNVTQCNTHGRACKVCGDDRAPWSHSYCKACEAKRVKRWRTGTPHPPL